MSDSLIKNEQGFTIIELVVSVAIGMLLLGVALSMFYIQRKSFITQEQISEMQQNVRAAMEIISRETRMAGYNPKKATFDGVTYDTSQLRIQADLNGDGVTTATDYEDITYLYYDETDPNYPREIKRKLKSTGTFQPLAENIEDFNFDYLDSIGTGTTASSEISQVRITIIGRTARPDPFYNPNNGYRTYTLTSYVTPKNLNLFFED